MRIFLREHRNLIVAALCLSSVVFVALAVLQPAVASALGLFYIGLVLTAFLLLRMTRR